MRHRPEPELEADQELGRTHGQHHSGIGVEAAIAGTAGEYGKCGYGQGFLQHRVSPWVSTKHTQIPGKEKGASRPLSHSSAEDYIGGTEKPPQTDT